MQPTRPPPPPPPTTPTTTLMRVCFRKRGEGQKNPGRPSLLFLLCLALGSLRPPPPSLQPFYSLHNKKNKIKKKQRWEEKETEKAKNKTTNKIKSSEEEPFSCARRHRLRACVSLSIFRFVLFFYKIVISLHYRTRESVEY